MHVEREKKWLVRPNGKPLPIEDLEYIRQGYLSVGDPEARIRLCTRTFGEPRVTAFFTRKWGEGEARRESEVEIPEEAALAFYHVCEHRVEKMRDHLRGGFELDRFMGRLDGLALMEFEYDEPGDIQLPDYVEVVRDVTSDPAFKNKNLAQLGEDEAKLLVDMAYLMADSYPPEVHFREQLRRAAGGA